MNLIFFNSICQDIWENISIISILDHFVRAQALFKLSSILLRTGYYSAGGWGRWTAFFTFWFFTIKVRKYLNFVDFVWNWVCLSFLFAAFAESDTASEPRGTFFLTHWKFGTLRFLNSYLKFCTALNLRKRLNLQKFVLQTKPYYLYEVNLPVK